MPQLLPQSLFFLKRIAFIAERLYDHIKWEMFQTCALTSPPRQAQVKQVHERYCACSTRSSNTAQRCLCALWPVSFHIKQQKKLRACNVLVMSSVKAWSYQNSLKTACMHAIYASHLRMCLWNGFKNCPEAPQHCLPHLTHPIQLVRSLGETLRPEVCQKMWRELWENKMRVTFSSSFYSNSRQIS